MIYFDFWLRIKIVQNNFPIPLKGLLLSFQVPQVQAQDLTQDQAQDLTQDQAQDLTQDLTQDQVHISVHYQAEKYTAFLMSKEPLQELEINW